MKILTISQFYKPDITAPAFRVTEMMEYLISEGHEVEIITADPHKNIIEGEIKDAYNVKRVRLPDTENKGFLGYIYLYLSFLIKSIIKGFQVGRKQKPDVVWATSPPIFVGLSGWILSKLLGAGFALDIRDVWPDSAVAAGQLSKEGFGYKIGRWLEEFLYKNADVITCVAKPMKNYIQSFTDTEVHVIYNGVDQESIDKVENKSSIDILEKYSSSNNSKKIIYAGNFGHVQELDLLIKALKIIGEKKTNHSWKVFFLGGGVKKDHLIKTTDSLSLNEKVHFLDPVPKDKVYDYLTNADVLFIHLQDSEVLRLTIPSKVFDYMLANRPLLAGIHGEGRKIIESVEGNFTFDSGNKNSLIESFLELDKQIGANGYPENKTTILESYSRTKQAEKLNNILKDTFLN
ncbi:MAG: glycosyltransferase family 4 protein [Bacteroidota bacterium]